MVANAVQAAMHRAGLSEAYAGRTGVLSPVAVAPGAACRIEGPAGYERTAHADDAGMLTGIPAPKAGSYVVRPSQGEPLKVGASLLAESETRLAIVQEIEFEEELSVAAAASNVRTDRVLWPLLAALAFSLLLGEWWYDQRGGRAR
jgi:hypothetical protein